MKLITSLALSLLLSPLALAADAPTTATAAAPVATAPKTISKDSQTNMAFDDLLIQGQYHFSDEAVVTVEDDKVLDALLGVRKDFKDRIQQSSTR